MEAALQKARPRPLPLSVLLSITLHRTTELESDLRGKGIRYSDRWRRDANGQRLLTLREIWVAIQWLPDNAALVLAANEGRPRWSYSDYLLADLFTIFTQRPHPWRPEAIAAQRKKATANAAAQRTARRRFAERNRRLSQSRTERG